MAIRVHGFWMGDLANNDKKKREFFKATLKE